MDRQPMRQVVAASLSGAALEWYDFNLYGISAGLIFGKLFFPTVAPIYGTLAALATFGAGFVLRPLGALFFGHFGDRLGRKRTLVATMLITGLATFLVGVLPDFRTAGVWAPILLVTLRLAQGFGLGGESAGATLLTVEHAPEARRGFWGSLPQTGASIGYLIALGMTSLFTALPQEQFLTWGWRIPFLFSVILLVAGLVVRLKIQETRDFRRVATKAKLPLVTALRKHPKELLVAFGARVGEAGSSQIYQPFAISYLTTTLGYGPSVALVGVLLYNVIGLVLIPVAGALSDRLGRKPIYLTGAAIVALSGFPYFWLLDSGSVPLIWLATSLAAVGGAVCMSGLQGTLFTEMFSVEVRYSSLGIATQMSALVAGFVPAVTTSFLVGTGGASWPAALVLVVLGLVSLGSSFALSGRKAQQKALVTL